MFSLNPRASLAMQSIGVEQQPVAIVEDFALDPEALIAYAESGEPFRATPGDFYPGIRKRAPTQYADDFCTRYGEVLREGFALPVNSEPRVIFCAMSITTTEPQRLRPVQRVPHFDTSVANQLAIVHYLCGPEHGGVSFYRHRSTGFETIGQDRIQHYSATLKREVTREHAPPAKYMDGDDPLFARIASYEARCNRALIYRSYALHSGNIRRILPPEMSPRAARLTVTSFVRYD
ncbi:MAG TPA: DUF6445 family protein [Steroidobacter sp.]|uniref:DUF6445 family protein n=1 Tax=Steroidobacter sp. TaxID=1978227 RepID=UPI002EDA2396